MDADTHIYIYILKVDEKLVASRLNIQVSLRMILVAPQSESIPRILQENLWTELTSAMLLAQDSFMLFA